jgi:predicted protein tyrosine phosphatase
MKISNLLFICSEGKNRSVTAADLYKNEYNTCSKGIYSSFIVNLEKEIAWADLIFVMEKQHEETLMNYYEKILKNKPVFNLNIEDIYLKNDPMLEKIIKEKVDPLLNLSKK